MLDAPLDPYPRFSDHEFGRRYRVLRERMTSADVAALVVFGVGGARAAAVQYLTNYPVSNRAHLVFPLDGEPSLFVQWYNHLPLARKLSVVADARWGGPSSIAAVADELADRGLTRARLGLVGELPFRDYLALRERLPKADLVDFNARFVAERLVKGEEEIDWLRRGAELSDRAAAALEREVRPGLREDELSLIVESAYLAHGGATQIHFICTTPMAAPQVCVPSQYPANRVLEPGDALVAELSAHYWGYPGQILRTYVLAPEPTPLYARLHEVALDVFERIFALLRPGATAREIVEASRSIEYAGFSIYDDLLHGYGGGYLPPILRTHGTLHEPVPDFTFEENMTVVIQPNVITSDERAGVQVGELVRITADGCESLHSFPRRLVVCEGG
jgi:Xaa-Pro aminopeptidase